MYNGIHLHVASIYIKLFVIGIQLLTVDNFTAQWPIIFASVAFCLNTYWHTHKQLKYLSGESTYLSDIVYSKRQAPGLWTVHRYQYTKHETRRQKRPEAVLMDSTCYSVVDTIPDMYHSLQTHTY